MEAIMSATLAPPVSTASPRVRSRVDASASTSHTRRWYTLGVLCLSLLVIVIDTTIVNVALPTFTRDLHASTSGLQWIVDAYTLTFAALLLLAGAIADRYGRHHALAAGLVIFAAGSLGAAVAGAHRAGASGTGLLRLIDGAFVTGADRAVLAGAIATLAGVLIAVRTLRAARSLPSRSASTSSSTRGRRG
jgi:MFS family permease